MPGRAKPWQPKSTAKQVVGTRRGNGAGKGDGWGGPARGASASRILPGDPTGVQALSRDPDIASKREDRLQLLRDHMFHLALNAAREETQLAAASAYLDREEGKPIARTVTAAVDDVSQLSDLELAAEIARIDRELASATPRGGEAAAGESPSDVSPLH